MRLISPYLDTVDSLTVMFCSRIHLVSMHFVASYINIINPTSTSTLIRTGSNLDVPFQETSRNITSLTLDNLYIFIFMFASAILS